MKTIVRTGIVVLALATGLAVGFYFGVKSSESHAFVGEMAEVAHYSAYLEVQRSEGDDAAYEEALRGYLALLEARKGKPSALFSERVHAVDSALTYARLSALALKRGANEEASRYLAEASALCPQLGWRECSAESITALAQRLDKGGLVGSAKTQ